MTRKNQLRQSGTRLQKQGTLWFQQTRNAGGTFLGETQNASVTFGRDMKGASTKLATTASRSTAGLQRALRKEGLEWQALVLQTRDAYVAAIERRLARAQSRVVNTREAIRPGSVETAVLRSAHDLLEQAGSRVDQRLGRAKRPAKPAKAASKKGQNPLRNYDQLTAKDVVGRIQRLSAPQATAVLDYERARKKRATVIRAAQERSTAAS